MSEHSNRNRQRNRTYDRERCKHYFPLLLVLGVIVTGTLMSGCANTDSSNPGIPIPSPLPGGGAVGLPSPGSPTGSVDGQPEGKTDGDSSGQAGETAKNDSGEGSKDSGKGTSGEDSGQAGEPGFETADSQDAQLPDLRDTKQEPSAKRGSFEGNGDAAEREPSAASQGDGTAANQSGDAAATSDEAGAGDGPRTSAEQVAILDAELERGTGNFDDLILAEQEEQRRRERDHAQQQPAQEPQEEVSSNNRRAGAYEGGMAGGSGGGAPPTNPVKYEPPPDIPSGDNDDVVARQLREAAMREPDPAVRERLWDEYRKYKGSD